MAKSTKNTGIWFALNFCCMSRHHLQDCHQIWGGCMDVGSADLWLSSVVKVRKEKTQSSLIFFVTFLIFCLFLFSYYTCSGYEALYKNALTLFSMCLYKHRKFTQKFIFPILLIPTLALCFHAKNYKIMTKYKWQCKLTSYTPGTRLLMPKC